MTTDEQKQKMWDTCTSFADTARSNYLADGLLQPVLAVIGRVSLIAKMRGGTDDMPNQFAQALYRLAPLVRPVMVVTVVETWHKSFPIGTERTLARGELERMHAAGDAAVKTALVTTAWAHDDDTAIAMVMDREEAPGEFARATFPGLQEGHMSDCVLGSWRDGLRDFDAAVSGLDDIDPEKLPPLIMMAIETAGTVDYATIHG